MENVIERQQAIKNELLGKYFCDGAPALSQERSSCITATDVACICNQNSFAGSDPVSTFRKKALRIAIPTNANMEHGKRYEPVALAKLTSKQLIDGSHIVRLFNVHFVKHPQYNWLGGTLDGVVELEDGRVMVVEVKCPKTRKIVPGVVPSYYMSQVQTYLMITGLDQCAFIQFKPTGRRGAKEVFDITIVNADREMMAIQMGTLRKFYIHLYMWNETCYKWLFARIQLARLLRGTVKGNPDLRESFQRLNKCTASILMYMLLSFSAQRRKRLLPVLNAEILKSDLENYGLSQRGMQCMVKFHSGTDAKTYDEIIKYRGHWLAHMLNNQRGFYEVVNDVGSQDFIMREICVVRPKQPLLRIRSARSRKYTDDDGGDTDTTACMVVVKRQNV